jgi:hypothetical protein
MQSVRLPNALRLRLAVAAGQGNLDDAGRQEVDRYTNEA